MLQIDLNRTSLIGLLLFFGAAVLFVVEHLAIRDEWTVATVLGDGAPYSKVPIWMVLAVVAMVVYIAGRVIWLVKNHRIVPRRRP
jgi:hypothetical protein